MSFPRYPEYKDSGVEWLGEVPAHWMVAPLKREFSVTLGKMLQPDSSDPEDELLPYLRAANIQWAGVDVSDIKQMWLSPRDRSQLALQLGDLLVSEGGDVGRSCLWGEEIANCSFQNSVNRVRAIQEGSTRFLYYWMSTIKGKGYVDVLCNKSTIAHFTAEKVAAVPVPFPTQSEQIGIATFLDRETAQIDALVAEQEKLIALLQEKRQAVISHAVTKGLDPNAPMKDSGVEWLGEVPEHWSVGKCGFYMRILSGFPFPSSGFTEDDSNHRLLRGANVGVSRLKWDDTVYWQRLEGDGLDEYEMSEGDLVIGMDRPLIGEGMRVAKVTAEDLPSLLLQRVASLKVGDKLNADYLHYLLSSEMFVAHFSPETTGVSVPHISPDQINKFIIPIPPISEQIAIVNEVKMRLALFGGLIAESEIAASLLQERRTALISAAVTGQIDVRSLAPLEAV
ncbi:restriction endonuclease subunit S [Simplicispira piscis]